MVSASVVPDCRFSVIVGGLESRCGVCRGVLLVEERGACAECRSVARKRALAVLTIASPHPTPVGAA